jgi:hypothetical protein
MQLLRGGNPTPKPTGRRRLSRKDMQLALARQAARERSFARYLHLECSHYITLETFDMYLVFRPKRGFAFCEIDNKWVKISKPTMRTAPIQEPMF